MDLTRAPYFPVGKGVSLYKVEIYRSPFWFKGMELRILWLQQRGGSHETTTMEGLKGRPIAELCHAHQMS